MIKTKEFAEIVGANYASVRQVYKFPARIPRHPGPESVDFEMGSHRRFVAADAIAWALASELKKVGFTWDDAAPLVLNSHFWLLSDYLCLMADPKAFFTVWQVGDELHKSNSIGSLPEAMELMGVDSEKYGTVRSVHSISLKTVFDQAQMKAMEAGYFLNLKDGEIYPLHHDVAGDDVFDAD